MEKNEGVARAVGEVTEGTGGVSGIDAGLRGRGQRGFTLTPRLKSCPWPWEKASAQRRPWVRGPDTEAQPPHGTIPEIEVPRGERVARLSWVDQVHLVKSL